MKTLDTEHHDWFRASLLLHLRIPLSQQKITMQEKSLEIAMRLHASPIQDMKLGVQQIHLQLDSLHLELQSLKKGREAQPEVYTEI